MTKKTDFSSPMLLLCCKELANYLIEQGANVNNCDQYGRTAVMWACMNRNSYSGELLFQYGQHVKLDNEHGFTPLMLVAFLGGQEVIETIINAGADVNATDVFGNTPLIYAAEHGQSKAVQILLDNGAKVCAKNDFGCTALTKAINAKNNEIINLLLPLLKGAESSIEELNLSGNFSINSNIDFAESLDNNLFRDSEISFCDYQLGSGQAQIDSFINDLLEEVEDSYEDCITKFRFDFKKIVKKYFKKPKNKAKAHNHARKINFSDIGIGFCLESKIKGCA